MALQVCLKAMFNVTCSVTLVLSGHITFEEASTRLRSRRGVAKCPRYILACLEVEGNQRKSPDKAMVIIMIEDGSPIVVSHCI